MTDTTSPANNDLLDATIDHDVIVFTKSRCVQCDQTKRLLRKNNIDFHEMNLENEEIRLTDQRYKTAYDARRTGCPSCSRQEPSIDERHQGIHLHGRIVLDWVPTRFHQGNQA